MAMYKSFGHGIIAIINGRTDKKVIVENCIKRTDGMIEKSESRSSAESDENNEEDEDESSNTEENALNPLLQQLFNENPAISNSIK